MNPSLEEKRIAHTLNEACLYLKELLDEGINEIYAESYGRSLGGNNNDTPIDVPIHIRGKEWKEHEPYIHIILCGAYRVREELQAIFSTFQLSDDLLASLESTISPFSEEEEDWKLLTLRSGWANLWNAGRLVKEAEVVVVSLPHDQYEVIERVIRGTSNFLGKNLSY